MNVILYVHAGVVALFLLASLLDRKERTRSEAFGAWTARVWLATLVASLIAAGVILP